MNISTHTSQMRLAWVTSILRGVVSYTQRINVPDFNNAQTAVDSHFRQLRVTEPHRRFTGVNPSNLSLALLPFVVSRCIRHYPLAVKPCNYSRRSFGWEQSLDTGLENYFSLKTCDIELHIHISIMQRRQYKLLRN